MENINFFSKKITETAHCGLYTTQALFRSLQASPWANSYSSNKKFHQHCYNMVWQEAHTLFGKKIKFLRPPPPNMTWAIVMILANYYIQRLEDRHWNIRGIYFILLAPMVLSSSWDISAYLKLSLMHVRSNNVLLKIGSTKHQSALVTWYWLLIEEKKKLIGRCTSEIIAECQLILYTYTQKVIRMRLTME